MSDGERSESGEVIRGQEAIAERPDGTRANFIPYPTPLRDGQGNLVGAINMLVDITERKKTEETLQRSERELTEFFENATEAIHWVGPDGTILRANKESYACRVIPPRNMSAEISLSFMSDQDLIHDILRACTPAKRLQDYRAQMRCKDGTIRDVLINSSA